MLLLLFDFHALTVFQTLRTLHDERIAGAHTREHVHVGATLGFRVEWNGISIAYLPDHGPGTIPSDADDYVPPEVLELCDGVDLLIHDAQHTPAEYELKRHWGHCTVDYAVHVAREAGARTLALFHHDPAHGDDEMDRLLAGACETGAAAGLEEVIAASEGLTLTF